MHSKSHENREKSVYDLYVSSPVIKTSFTCILCGAAILLLLFPRVFMVVLVELLYNISETTTYWFWQLACHSLVSRKCADTGDCHSVIQRLGDRFINTETVKEARMSGRPNVGHDRYVVLVVLGDRTATYNAIRAHVQATTNISVRDQTFASGFMR